MSDDACDDADLVVELEVDSDEPIESFITATGRAIDVGDQVYLVSAMTWGVLFGGRAWRFCLYLRRIHLLGGS